MKNNGSAKIVVILVALAVVLGVGYVAVTKKSQVPEVEENDGIVVDSLPKSCTNAPLPGVDTDKYPPVVTSLSQYSGPVGTQLEIRGCNFSGFEGDKNAWIENGEGVKGILYGHLSGASTSKLLNVTLSSPLCSSDPSYAGASCAEFAKLRGEELKMLYLIPREYKIYVEPWGKRSNEVNFTITE
ncbi:MAG: hypothetical protein Q8P01_05500 [bacterium]|nr:hypothetical protein [bacterium]